MNCADAGRQRYSRFAVPAGMDYAHCMNGAGEPHQYFIAISLSSGIAERAESLIRQLKQSGAKVSWTRPEKMHVTLEFLGKLSPEGVAAVRRGMDITVPANPVFLVSVDGLGTFGKSSHPRVIWAGINNPDGHLLSVRAGLHDVLLSSGLELEERDFRPHLTLGRVKGTGRLDALTSALRSAKSVRLGTAEIRSVKLFGSFLERQGSRYEILHETPLKEE